MRRRDATVQVMLNGEIYNFQGLRNELSAAPPIPLAQRHGGDRSSLRERAPVHPTGLKACLLSPSGTIAGSGSCWRAIAAGKKPLFTPYGRQIVFASEMKAFFGTTRSENRHRPAGYPRTTSSTATCRALARSSRVQQVEPEAAITVERDGTMSSRTY